MDVVQEFNRQLGVVHLATNYDLMADLIQDRLTIPPEFDLELTEQIYLARCYWTNSLLDLAKETYEQVLAEQRDDLYPDQSNYLQSIAAHELATLYQKENQLELAVTYLQQAAVLDHPVAMYQLARYWLFDLDSPRLMEGIAYLKTSFRLGYPEAGLELAQLGRKFKEDISHLVEAPITYYRQLLGDNPDPTVVQRARGQLVQLVDETEAETHHLCLYHDVTVDSTLRGQAANSLAHLYQGEMSWMWHRHATDLDNLNSLFLLATHHAAKKEMDLAVHYHTRAAELGSPPSCHFLADHYWRTDTSRALQYLRRAAEQNDVAAMIKLGDYFRGKNNRYLIKYYRQAIQHKSVEAMKKLAAWYHGRGELDMYRSTLQLAISAGDIDSMLNLAADLLRYELPAALVYLRMAYERSPGRAGSALLEAYSTYPCLEGLAWFLRHAPTDRRISDLVQTIGSSEEGETIAFAHLLLSVKDLTGGMKCLRNTYQRLMFLQLTTSRTYWWKHQINSDIIGLIQAYF